MRSLARLSLSVAVVAALALPASPAAADEPAPPEAPETLSVTAAELRWGVNNESNNRAFAPGTVNFFRAGKLPDPGRGGQVIGAAQWVAAEGNVSIEKSTGDGYQPATWAGLSTTAGGSPLGAASAGTFSDHQFVFANGTGTIDPATDSASIAWDGDVTIVYYSGMTFFYLSDPRLEVTDGTGTLSAELSGFASSMDDLTHWGPVAPRRATVATFTGAEIDEAGVFTGTPAYRGVTTSPAQVTGCDVCGSFPAEFIRFQEEAGAAPYWYSSGGATDRFKSPLPVTVLPDGDVAPPPPPAPSAGVPAPIVNEVLAPPPAPAPAAPSSATPRATAPVVAPLAAEATRPVSYQSAGDQGWLLASSPTRDQIVWWLLAAGLLGATATTVAGSAVYVRRLRPRA